MPYISLYRKYRPKTFSDVVGQEVVIKILKNSILTGKIGHAYIFSGPRGTGKTSIAKIFSKAVNCLENDSGDLCGKCSVCLSDFDDEIDIVEIDAASNNGVDEIREIRTNVKLVPNHLKYKVYIIDEVHMLSTSAFNALLKTLEEPPSNVIFILATTEFNKIPATVISRCQKFDFKKLTINQIENRLNYILDKENKTIKPEVVELISQLSDGGMRDAINMLDQLISLDKTDIDNDDVYNLIGDISENKIFELLKEITENDVKNILESVDLFFSEGKNFINITNRLQTIIRNIIIYNNSDNYFSKEYEQKLNNFAKIDLEKFLDLSSILFKLSNELKKTTNQKVLVEIYLLKASLIFDKKNIEKVEQTAEISQKTEVKNESKKDEEKEIKINNALCGADKLLKNSFVKNYENIKEYLSNKEYNSVANLMQKAMPEVVSENNILFSFKNSFEVVLFEKNIVEIQKLLKQIFDKKYSIVAVNIDEWNEIKKEYINNIKNGKKYEYIEEIEKIEKSKKTTILENTIENLFGDSIINNED